MPTANNVAQASRLSFWQPVTSVRANGAILLWVIKVALPLTLLGFSGAVKSETLNDAMRSAYSNNPQLDAERARLRATDETVSQAKAGYRPTVTGSASFANQHLSQKSNASESSGNTSPVEYELRAQQSVFNGWQTTNALNEAEANVRAGRENLRRVENDTLLNAATVYMDVVRDQVLIAIRLRNVDVLSSELRAAQARRAVREVTLTDVAQARARRARAVSAADQAKANLRISRANFERVVGHAPGQVISPGLYNRQLPKALNEALSIGERESPRVISALYREQASRFAVGRERGALLPQVNVEASYRNKTGSSPSLSREAVAQVGARITMPFYRGGEVHSRVRQAKHTHVSHLQEIEQARAETQAAITSAWSQLIAARARMQADQVQVDAARLALEGVREEERVGQRTLLDVLNAEQESLEADVALVQTKRDLIVAGYNVLAQMGRLTAAQLQLSEKLYDEEQHYHEVRNQWFGISITHADGREQHMFISEEMVSDVAPRKLGRGGPGLSRKPRLPHTRKRQKAEAVLVPTKPTKRLPRRRARRLR